MIITSTAPLLWSWKCKARDQATGASCPTRDQPAQQRIGRGIGPLPRQGSGKVRGLRQAHGAREAHAILPRTKGKPAPQRTARAIDLRQGDGRSCGMADARQPDIRASVMVQDQAVACGRKLGHDPRGAGQAVHGQGHGARVVR